LFVGRQKTIKKVKIIFHAGINKYLNFQKTEKKEFSEEKTIYELCQALNLEGSIYLILQNGKKVKSDDTVKNNAIIEIYPIFGGG
jgi:sulfur carrier protein ThiS